MIRHKRIYDPVKRILDVVFAFVLLVLTLPIQLMLAVVVANRLGTPVFFAQARPGLGGKPFTLLKFRSMKDIDIQRNLVSDEDRLTPFGKKLRSTSLDELPSLWNILKGDMSFIGPRPLLVEYLPLYNDRQSSRHDVRPGLTGLAQVNGRNQIPWAEKLELDVVYVENRNVLLDLNILFQTVRIVLRRDGISSSGEVTTSRFNGEN